MNTQWFFVNRFLPNFVGDNLPDTISGHSHHILSDFLDDANDNFVMSDLITFVLIELIPYYGDEISITMNKSKEEKQIIVFGIFVGILSLVYDETLFTKI